MKIFLAIAAGDALITSGIGGFIGRLRSRPEQYYLGIANQSRGIAYARNVLAEHFMGTDADKLLFLDADVVPPDNAFDILNVDADIVSGTYLQILSDGKDAQLHYIVGGKDFNMKPIPESGGVIDATFVPFGCTLISREVIADPRMILDSDIRPRAFFQEIRDSNGLMRASDDVEYCMRASSFGYSIKCHTDVRFGHVKHIDLNLLQPLLVEPPRELV